MRHARLLAPLAAVVTAGYDVFEAKWRQRDYDVMTSPEFRQTLKDNDVVLVTWREIQKAMYPSAP